MSRAKFPIVRYRYDQYYKVWRLQTRLFSLFGFHGCPTPQLLRCAR